MKQRQHGRAARAPDYVRDLRELNEELGNELAAAKREIDRLRTIIVDLSHELTARRIGGT